MLVLSRKRAESIQINDNVILTVLEIRGNSVRLGIQAPRSVPVFRTELREQTTETPGPLRAPQLPARHLAVPSGPLVEVIDPPTEPKRASATDGQPWQRICPNCQTVHDTWNRVCGCGHTFTARAGPSIHEGEQS